MSNAFKFTPENGKITVEIKPKLDVRGQFFQKINDDSSHKHYRNTIYDSDRKKKELSLF